MRTITLFIAALALLAPCPAALADSPPFELKDGDRVCFIGNTFTEREQQHGYIELALTVRHPDKHIIFRNLGWSGDNVWGESRARFGDVNEGFRHLIDHTKAQKPTLLIVSYGHNAAFEGEKGLAKFIEGYTRLLDTLQKETEARVALITPYPHENLGPPLPDPSEYNQYLGLYVKAIKDLATKRGHALLDLSELGPIRVNVITEAKVDNETTRISLLTRFNNTDNGIHLTDIGYWRAAAVLAEQFAPGSSRSGRWLVNLNTKGEVIKTVGTTLSDVQAGDNTIAFKALDDVLPLPTVAPPLAEYQRVAGSGKVLASPRRRILVDGLAPGTYQVRIDGRPFRRFVVTATDDDKPAAASIIRSLELDQSEKLRTLIIKKNELFFHRYRPANETYIFLFRKHEQGQNAKEMPQFDPLIEELEKEIAKLKKPVAHKYDIVRLKDER